MQSAVLRQTRIAVFKARLRDTPCALRSRLRPHDEWAAAGADTRFLAERFPDPSRMLAAARRRMLVRGMPLDHVLGWTPFLGAHIRVRTPVLIPRQDTSFWLSELISQWRPAWRSVLDVCTGSGCIAIAIAMHTRAPRVHAIDISPAALLLASQNALRNGTNVTLSRLDVLGSTEALPGADITIANPPYLSPSSRRTMGPSVLRWEDRRATMAPDRAVFYRAILAGARSPCVALELDGTAAHVRIVSRIATALGYTRSAVFRDTQSYPRAVLFERL